MGFMSAIGPCFGCGRVFSFNPTYVPSFRGEPVCEFCIARANEGRPGNGLPVLPVHPMAYEAEEVA